MEYLKMGCTDEDGEMCDLCNDTDWIGPPSSQIPQPIPGKYMTKISLYMHT